MREEESGWQQITQNSGPWEEAARVELRSMEYEKNEVDLLQ